MKKNKHYFIDTTIAVPQHELTSELFQKFVNVFITKNKKQRWMYLNKSNRHIAANTKKLIGDIESHQLKKMFELKSSKIPRSLNNEGIILDIYNGWQINSLKFFLSDKDFKMLYLDKKGFVVLNNPDSDKSYWYQM